MFNALCRCVERKRAERKGSCHAKKHIAVVILVAALQEKRSAFPACTVNQARRCEKNLHVAFP